MTLLQTLFDQLEELMNAPMFLKPARAEKALATAVAYCNEIDARVNQKVFTVPAKEKMSFPVGLKLWALTGCRGGNWPRLFLLFMHTGLANRP